MTQPPSDPHALVAAATAVARDRATRHEHLWAMTREQRIAAFYRGELTFSDCQAWSRRYPQEPPRGPAAHTSTSSSPPPEWLGET